MTASPLKLLGPNLPGIDWLIIGLVHAALAWTAMQFSPGGGQVAAIWLPDAVMVAIGFASRMPLARLLPPIVIAHAILLLTRGNSIPSLLSLTAANTIEIAVALFLMRRSFTQPDKIKEPRCLARFLGIAGLAAAISGLIGAAAIAGVSDSYPVVLWQWWLAHAMAMMTLAPILLLIEAERRDCRRRDVPLVDAKDAIDIALGALAIVAIFAQTTYPLLFLAAPVIQIGRAHV